MKNVAILAYNQCAFFELGCAIELFALPRPEFNDWYHSKVVTFEQAPIYSTAGIQLGVEVITSLAEFDLLIIPSWPVDLATIPPPLKTAITQFYNAGGKVVSFCSGAFLLGYMGLLDNLPATTHWQYATKFQQLFPNVHYQADVLYVNQQSFACSAGSAAAIDLGLAIIKQDFGYKIANQVARRLVISAQRQGGQSQYAETPVPKFNNTFADTLDWALTHLSNPISVDQLADHANMSRRSFDRKFRADLGSSPHAWLITQRLNLAKQLLEDAELSIEKVAELSGFDNAMSMRHHFRQRLGISPNDYKQQFSSALD